MNVDLNKQFPLDHDGDKAWQLLKDVEAVAGCMPGAEISEVVDENNYKGKVKVKLGPVNMAFNGDIIVKGIDAEARQIQLFCEGQDNKGTSKASMDLTANISDSSDSASELVGDAKVVVNGKLASFGQRMMAQVSDQILEQFAENFRKKLIARAADDNAVDANSSIDGTTDEKPVDAGDVSSDTNTNTNTSASASASNDTSSSGNEINGFKFALNAIIGLITGLFKRK